MGLFKSKEDREVIKWQEQESARKAKEAAEQAEIQKQQTKRAELMQLSEKELFVEILLQLKDVNDHLAYIEAVMPMN